MKRGAAGPNARALPAHGSHTTDFLVNFLVDFPENSDVNLFVDFSVDFFFTRRIP